MPSQYDTQATTVTRLAPYREQYEKGMLGALFGTPDFGLIKREGESDSAFKSRVDAQRKQLLVNAGLDTKPKSEQDAYLARFQVGLGGVGVKIPEIKAAGLDKETLEAQKLAKAGIGGYKPYLTKAEAEMAKVAPEYAKGISTVGAGIPYATAAYGEFAPTTARLKTFLDPYQDLVTAEAMKEIDKQAAQARTAQAARAVKSGAFGGGREGVEKAELEKNILDIKAKRVAEDKQKNYLQALTMAQEAFEKGKSRDLSIATALQNLGTQQAGIGSMYGTLAGQQSQLGGTATEYGLRDVGTLSQIGQQNQKQKQMEYDAARQTEMQRAYEPYQRLGYTSDILRGLPSAQTTMQTATSPTPSPLSGWMGAGLTGLGIYGALSGKDWGTNMLTAGSNYGQQK